MKLKRNNGYSLFEMLIVLVIAAILIALTFGMPKLFVQQELVLYTKKIAQTIFYLKESAQIDQKKKILSFDVNQRSYASPEVVQLPESLFFGTHVPLKGPPSSPAHTIINPITFKEQKIICAPDGTCSAGTLYLSNGTQTTAITLDIGDSALPRIYVYDQRWQLISE